MPVHHDVAGLSVAQHILQLFVAMESGADTSALMLHVIHAVGSRVPYFQRPKPGPTDPWPPGDAEDYLVTIFSKVSEELDEEILDNELRDGWIHPNATAQEVYDKMLSYVGATRPPDSHPVLCLFAVSVVFVFAMTIWFESTVCQYCVAGRGCNKTNCDYTT
jgi:hypothetical protein